MTIRPTTRDPARAWHRAVPIVVVAVVVVLAGAVGVAWWQDRNGGYPGYRFHSEVLALSTRLLPPTNSQVDQFGHTGSIGRVGSFRWRVAAGSPWQAVGRLAQAPKRGGVIVVDPHDRRIIAQVLVFRPVKGAGLVFRWRDEADHFSVEVAPGRAALLVVATIGGVRSVLATIGVNPQGSTVRVTLDGAHLAVAVNGGTPFQAVDPRLDAATEVGLQAPDDETGFGEFAVLPS